MTEKVDLGGFGSVKSPRVSALHVQPAGEDQQIKLVACPGFEPAIERQGSYNWENNFPVNSLILHSNSLFRRVGNLAKIAREFRGL